MGWLWDYANSKEYSREDKDFEELLEDYQKRLNKIKEVYHPKDDNELKQIALSFDNIYSQRKIVEANNGLKWATWVLAFATIIFAAKELWGAEETTSFIYKLFAVVVPAIVIIILIIIGFVMGRKIVKFVIKWVIGKSKHIWCIKCGRIIKEFEEEGDKRPSFTTCPECFKKKNEN